jgi:chemotaxis protein CheD
METIRVGMADLSTSKHPSVLITQSLGSCVGIALYDKKRKNIGLAHIMLSDSKLIKNNSNTSKFADTAIEELLRQMFLLGSSKCDIIAKIAGGACMFTYKNNVSNFLNIGQRNIESTIKHLEEKCIPLISKDVGGDYARTVELDSECGDLKIKTIAHGIKII